MLELLETLIDWLSILSNFSSIKVEKALNNIEKAVEFVYSLLNDANPLFIRLQGSVEKQRLAASVAKLFLNGFLNIADGWILFVGYEKLDQESKELINHIMLEFAKADNCSFAKALSQALIHHFFRLSRLENGFILKLAEEFVRLLKSAFQKNVICESAYLIICDGLVFTFNQTNERIGFLNVLKKFSILLSSAYKEMTLHFLEEVSGCISHKDCELFKKCLMVQTQNADDSMTA